MLSQYILCLELCFKHTTIFKVKYAAFIFFKCNWHTTKQISWLEGFFIATLILNSAHNQMNYSIYFEVTVVEGRWNTFYNCQDEITLFTKKGKVTFWVWMYCLLFVFIGWNCFSYERDVLSYGPLDKFIEIYMFSDEVQKIFNIFFPLMH